ncbi:hypothetical protein K7X08_003937 [Anisodus acutangulus]|uniref:Fungal lipase-type domain-containing protein n=1 Tax=Anisodus acutangulus TaxID=402998 RepID=A0A9Q1MHS5_9SOLA|nr:hypothetical protein K7X08_003937 [Anisodus acutangulus]
MVRIGEGIEVKDELIKKACNLAMEAHNLSSGKPYIYRKKSLLELGLLMVAFASRFEDILNKSSLKNEVEKAMSDGKQIVFAGHSSGGLIAILAALWCLEYCRT